jgi:hypothetical protein
MHHGFARCGGAGVLQRLGHSRRSTTATLFQTWLRIALVGRPALSRSRSGHNLHRLEGLLMPV